jgi:hypothetical protein
MSWRAAVLSAYALADRLPVGSEIMAFEGKSLAATIRVVCRITDAARS